MITFMTRSKIGHMGEIDTELSGHGHILDLIPISSAIREGQIHKYNILLL